MELQKRGAGALQWHPAFFADIQIELKDDADNLIFENEHQLGTKPKEIDVLIIKKETEIPVRKNIGRIFRKHNIIEYKSPTDYLSIDAFYKVYGYACFYKSDVKHVDDIQVEELTITLISQGYPKKLLHHLRDIRNYRIRSAEPGIYYIIGDKIPIQIIVINELSVTENLWLKSLTNHVEKVETAERLLEEYRDNMDNTLYRSVMNMIVSANKDKFVGVGDMCEALEELMMDRIEEKADKRAKEIAGKMAEEMAVKMAEEMVGKMAEEMVGKMAEEMVGKMAEEMAGEMAEEMAVKMAREMAGKMTGELAADITEDVTEKAENRMNGLILKLSESGRLEDILKAAEDKEYKQKLFEEFGL